MLPLAIEHTEAAHTEQVAQAVTPPTRIREVFCSNLGLETDYPEVFLSLSRHIPG
jgi:hypothetical protein